MKKRKVKIILKDGGQAPIYSTERSSGADVKANEDFFCYKSRGANLITTGFKYTFLD